MNSKECTLNNSELLKAVNDWVSSLCETGGRSWSLRVPVDFNRDPDILISEMGKRLSKLEAENRELRDHISFLVGISNPWDDNDMKRLLSIEQALAQKEE